MITENKSTLTAYQRQLAVAVERIKAAAKREGRDLTEEELAHSEALTAAVVTLTRAINIGTDIAASAASAGADRRHALARGPPSAHEAIWRWRTVCAHTGISRPTLWRLVKDGRFPKPIHITGGHAVGWVASEVQEWILARIAQRHHQQQRVVPTSRGRPRKADAGA